MTFSSLPRKGKKSKEENSIGNSRHHGLLHRRSKLNGENQSARIQSVARERFSFRDGRAPCGFLDSIVGPFYIMSPAGFINQSHHGGREMNHGPDDGLLGSRDTRDFISFSFFVSSRLSVVIVSRTLGKKGGGGGTRDGWARARVRRRFEKEGFVRVSGIDNWVTSIGQRGEQGSHGKVPYIA